MRCRAGSSIFFFLSVLIILFIIYHISIILHDEQEISPSTEVVQNITECHASTNRLSGQPSPWDTVHYVNGPPKNRFQDNLLNDTFYITAWGNAGLTNQFIGLTNMIYLGLITDRIPILPPFTPDGHISPSAGHIPFGEIFNLTELRRHLRKPVLEWSDLKTISPRFSLNAPPAIEEIGCWSIRTSNYHLKDPVRATNLLHSLGLEVSYTRLPPHISSPQSLADEAHIGLIPLAQKIYPQSPISNPEDNTIMAPSTSGAKISPDHHMSCFDFMYFASVGTQPYEWKSPWSPVWRFVGRHLRFTDFVVDIAKQYVHRALKITSDQLPLFITVHARRGDFAHQCFDVPEQCLAPLSAFVRKVEEVRESLSSKMNVDIRDVIITSDEKDPVFWKEVEEVGWKYIDHAAEHTVELYGEWYLPVIDIAVQSLGIGFVGSQDSTLSALSARRVEEWNDGIARVVNWGGRD